MTLLNSSAHSKAIFISVFSTNWILLYVCEQYKDTHESLCASGVQSSESGQMDVNDQCD